MDSDVGILAGNIFWELYITGRELRCIFLHRSHYNKICFSESYDINGCITITVIAALTGLYMNTIYFINLRIHVYEIKMNNFWNNLSRSTRRSVIYEVFCWTRTCILLAKMSEQIRLSTLHISGNYCRYFRFMPPGRQKNFHWKSNVTLCILQLDLQYVVSIHNSLSLEKSHNIMTFPV